MGHCLCVCACVRVCTFMYKNTKTNEPKQIVCIILVATWYIQNAILLIKNWTYRYRQSVDPLSKNISEQLTKWITSTQQLHFSELKLNRCVEKGSFQWSQNVTKLDLDVGIFCCPKIILTPVRVNSFCSFLLLLLLFPHTTFRLVNPHCGLPSPYQQVSCATMLKCTRLVLCLAFPKIIYSKWLGQIQIIIFFQKVMRENRGTTKREESWDLTESSRGFVRLEMLSEIGGLSVTELKHW